jgi:hypothetical protein
MDQIFFLNDKMEKLFVVDPNFKREPCQNPNGTWTLEFDGAHSSFGSGACIFLTSPSRDTFYFSYRLKYDYTNNVSQYKYFPIGLNLSIDRKIRHIRVIGYFDLVVSQISLKFDKKNERIKKYRYFVRDTMKYFKKISIKVVPREENYIVDTLAVSRSTLKPCEGPLQYLCKMEVVFIPSVLGNMEHWKVFDDDSQTLRFLENSKECFDSQVNFLAKSIGLEVVNFPNNTLPKGCIPLEKMFDRNDVYRGKHVEEQSDKVL